MTLQTDPHITRLTNGFSRKPRNLKAAVALFFAHTISAASTDR